MTPCHTPSSLRTWLAVLVTAVFAGCGGPDNGDRSYSERVEIRRTTYGIPHILAEDLGALAFGLAYAHMEDYGVDLVHRLVRVRGQLSLQFGRDSIESDFWWRRRYRQAAAAYPHLHPDARDLYEGYAAGVNRYIEIHRDEFPDWILPDYEGPDITAHWVDENFQPSVNEFRRSQEARRLRADSLASSGDGSNAWAFGPDRITSGHAVLVRNPHLRWGSGYYGAYYEAHITVPGVIDFYGDFRVGYPMYFNGGFNRHLGWATTNNSPDNDEVYALDLDPDQPDHYLLDGQSIPLDREELTIEFVDDGTRSSETREYWHTTLGPVIDRDEDAVYVLRSSDWGEFRRTEQFLRMMQAENLGQWKDAMRMRAMTESNFTYADREGNIFFVSNAAIPILPHESGRDTASIRVERTEDVWTDLVPFDSLPQLLNPPGGYLHNENDSFHYTNLNQLLQEPTINAAWQGRRLRLRSQLSLELIHDDVQRTLEEVIELKHSPRMLLADRVKDDLVDAVRETEMDERLTAAIEMLERWDNTAAAGSRGGVLFEAWWRGYVDRVDQPFREEWSEEHPTTTPSGVAHPEVAAEVFAQAVRETEERYGSWDIPWGDVHRVRWGGVDVPVSGCPSSLGCFRHLGFREAEDGKQVAYTGDAWILGIEFGESPRAFSILVFGQSSKEDSPHIGDQTEMFARGELKPVAFSEEQIQEQLVRTYRPGVELAESGP